MNSYSSLTVEEDAPPIVRVFGNMFRRSLNKLNSFALVDSLPDSFAIKSSKDPQSLTVTVQHRDIHLSGGVSKDAKLVFVLDLGNPDAKPRIKNLWRHPLYAYRIGKLLTLPQPGWQEAAKHFWRAFENSNDPHLPSHLKITSSDDESSITFGGGDDSVELIGSSAALQSALAGDSIVIADIMQGRLQARGHMKHLAGLSHLGQQLMLGEIGEGEVNG